MCRFGGIRVGLVLHSLHTSITFLFLLRIIDQKPQLIITTAQANIAITGIIVVLLSTLTILIEGLSTEKNYLKSIIHFSTYN